MSWRREKVEGIALDATSAGSNLALWLERFMEGPGQEAVGEHHRSVDNVKVPEGYTRALKDRRAIIEKATGGFAGGVTREYELELDGRAVVGIGAASVRETGLSLLRPWGVPFIPGSALKGLASRVAHHAGGAWRRAEKAGGVAGEQHQRMFGDIDVAGSVIFHDAWWDPKGKHELPVHPDTMTVHHQAYYTGEAAPSDTDEPVPVSFLSTSGTYVVALSGPLPAVEIAAAILRRGLRDFGIGAKTAAGYGRGSLGEAREPPRPPRSPEEKAKDALPLNLERVSAQVNWLLKSGRACPEDVPEAVWKAAIRDHLTAAVAHLQHDDGQELANLEQALRDLGPRPSDRARRDPWTRKRNALKRNLKSAKKKAESRNERRDERLSLIQWVLGDDDGSDR